MEDDYEKIFFIVLFLMLPFINTFAECSASATTTNECDSISLSITADENCSCQARADYVTCSGTNYRTDSPDNPGGTTTYNITKTSPRLKNCNNGGDTPGGESGDEKGGYDLSWCTGCVNSDGTLTPYGEFVVLANT